MQMKGSKPHAAKPKHKMRRVVVERAGNGYTISHHPEPSMTRRPGGMMMSNDEPAPKDMVFSGKGAHKKMLAHVSQQMPPDEEEGESQPGAPPTMAMQG